MKKYALVICSFALICSLFCSCKEKRVTKVLPKVYLSNYLIHIDGKDTDHTCTLENAYTHDSYYGVKVPLALYNYKVVEVLDVTLEIKGENEDNYRIIGWRTEHSLP